MTGHWSSGMAIVSALLCLSESAQPAEPPTPDEILSAWRQRTVGVRMEWRTEIDAGVNRFSQFAKPNTAASAKPASPDRLEVDGERFRYSGVRLIIGEHGYRPGEVVAVTFTLSQMFPERQQDAFERALESRFENPNQRIDAVQPFVRVGDGSAVCDFWEAGQNAYPRATIHRSPEAGSADWALLSLDEPGHELESLDLCAAQLALHPGHPLFGINGDDCTVSRQPVLVAGTPCWAMTQLAAADAQTSRTFWVDPEREFLVRRFLGVAPEDTAQIDIDFVRSDSMEWVPDRWTVMLRGVDQAPIQQFIQSTVTRVEAAQPLTEQVLNVSWPVGTWVVDEPAAEQYLVQPDGKQRAITRDEFRWLPTYDELRATDSGQVGILIEKKIQQRQFWGQAKWPLVIGVIAFAGAALFKLLQRPRNRQTTEQTEALPV